MSSLVKLTGFVRTIGPLIPFVCFKHSVQTRDFEYVKYVFLCEVRSVSQIKRV